MLQPAGRAERRPTGDANGRDKDPTPTTQTQAQGASGSVPIAAFTRPRLLLLESLWPAAAHWPLLCVAAPLITPPVPKCLLCPVHSLPRWAHTSLGPCRRACSPVPAEGKGCRRVRRGARARNETDDDPRAEARRMHVAQGSSGARFPRASFSRHLRRQASPSSQTDTRCWTDDDDGRFLIRFSQLQRREGEREEDSQTETTPEAREDTRQGKLERYGSASFFYTVFFSPWISSGNKKHTYNPL